MNSFGSSPTYSYSLPIHTYGLSLTVLSYLAGSKSVSAGPLSARMRPTDTMTNSALEAIASSSGKTLLTLEQQIQSSVDIPFDCGGSAAERVHYYSSVLKVAPVGLQKVHKWLCYASQCTFRLSEERLW